MDGWNVTVRPTPASGTAIAIAPNKEATVNQPATPPSAAGTAEVLSINCGGGPIGFFRFGTPPHNIFARDYWYFSKGGKTGSTTNAIDVQGANAAPASVYQTERSGECTYTLPVDKGSPYTVRLHFAENKFGSGQRKFNVAVNGQRVLTDFDISAEGGQNKAVVKDFTSITPDTNGNITIALTRGAADEPKLCGIQILK